jgi:hypothetical protein
VIAFNGLAGVLIGFDPANSLDDDAGVGNSVLRNSIHSNGGLGIDLGQAGTVTLNDLNDSDTGANNLQNFPVLQSAISVPGSGVYVSGLIDTLPNRFYRIEFFSGPAADASGRGEGRTFLGAVTVFYPSGSDTVSFSTLLGVPLDSGDYITATATDLLTGNTSEFALNITVI